MTNMYYPSAANEVASLQPGTACTNTFDLAARPASFSCWNGSAWTTLAQASGTQPYTAAGQLSSWTEGSIALSRSYDTNRGWMNSLSVDNGNVLQMSYTYNPNGQAASVTD